MSRRTILPQLYGDLTHIHSYTTIVGDGIYMCVMYAIVDYEWKRVYRWREKMLCGQLNKCLSHTLTLSGQKLSLSLSITA